MVDKKQIRTIFFFEFKMNRKAAKSTRNNFIWLGTRDELTPPRPPPRNGEY